MENFTLYNPTRVLFGEGRLRDIRALIPAGMKVLILYGGGSAVRSGLIASVRGVLSDFSVGEFGGIGPNPEYETLMKAVGLVREEGYGFLLAVGGGSVIDATKFIAAAVNFDGGDPWKILSERAEVKTALPFGTVLTLPATGSEMNSGAVVTRVSVHAKLDFASPLVYPSFSVLDPRYTYTLPARQVTNGIVDAYVHVMEQYLTYPADAMIQDRYAEGILMTLIEVGPAALREPENYGVRANLMWAATMALNNWIGVGVPQDWASHLIGHAVTALYGVDHGRTLAAVYPAVMTVMKEPKRGKILQYAKRVWGISCGGDEAVAQAIKKTVDFFEQVGAPTHLSAYGLGREIVAPTVENLRQNGLTALGEKGEVTPRVAERILLLAL